MKQTSRVLVIVALLSLGACVAGSGEATHMAMKGGLAQFILGLWHGLIAPLTMILEVLDHLDPGLLPWKVHIYQAAAQGIFYDLGFYIGIAGSPVVIWSRGRR